jgi:hypothetical protein
MQRRPSTVDITWFLDMNRTNQLDLSPPYQRRSVWSPKDRRYFLDTIFRGYPCPPVFLHKNITSEGKATYAVVDGKQRLETLLKFVNGEVSLAKDYGDARLNGKSWDLLDEAEKRTFWNYVVPVEYLTFDSNDRNEVNQVFDRLNRNMRHLDPQELRHARWEGWFITFVEAEADEPTWKALGTVTTARIKRMKDAQFISELLLVVIDNAMRGFDQDTLDDAYGKYDDIEDLADTVDIDEIKQRVSDGKQYLLEMQNANGCVKKHASSLSAFYTLWSLVILHRPALPDARRFADLFADFWACVKQISQEDDQSQLFSGESAALYQAASKFNEANKGATTDLTPRAKRLDAILDYIRRRTA